MGQKDRMHAQGGVQSGVVFAESDECGPSRPPHRRHEQFSHTGRPGVSKDLGAVGRELIEVDVTMRVK
jgi:hypothetical protein